MAYSPALVKLIEAFQQLPGVGPKSAQRLAFYMLKQSDAHVAGFATTLLEAKQRIGCCTVCFNLSEKSPCDLCVAVPRHASGLLCVVADAKDVESLERTGEYKGLYHVLEGLISPLEGIGPDDLRVKELIARLAQPSPIPNPDHPTDAPSLQEVILALAPSIEGDTTSLYLTRLLKPLGVKLSRIAFGLPMGGELEYSDTMTISRALMGRVLL
jgi:recombination protein RecR